MKFLKKKKKRKKARLKKKKTHKCVINIGYVSMIQSEEMGLTFAEDSTSSSGPQPDGTEK